MNATSPESQTSLQSALPDRWVAAIFTELLTLYGSRFSDLWAGIDPAAVRASWGQKLAGFKDRPECIRLALDACDEIPTCPNLPQFLHLCRDAARRAGPQHLALSAPTISQETADARSDEAEALAEKMRQFAPSLAFARKLRERYLSGEKLIDCQILLASGALNETWKDGQCTPAVKEAA